MHKSIIFSSVLAPGESIISESIMSETGIFLAQKTATGMLPSKRLHSQLRQPLLQEILVLHL